MEYKEALQALEANAEMKDILEAIRTHNTAKNEDLKTVGEEIKSLKSSNAEMLNMMKTLGEATGKKVEINPNDPSSVNVFTRDLEELRKSISDMQAQKESEHKEMMSIKKRNEISKALDSVGGVGILDDVKEDLLKSVALDYDYTNDGILANKDGVRLSEGVESKFSKMPQFLKNPVKTGANVDNPVGDVGVDKNHALVMDAVRKAREGVN